MSSEGAQSGAFGLNAATSMALLRTEALRTNAEAQVSWGRGDQGRAAPIQPLARDRETQPS